MSGTTLLPSLRDVCWPRSFLFGIHNNEQTNDAGPLNQIESPECGLGFDEVDEQPPREVGSEKDAEGCAFAVRVFVEAVEQECEHEEEGDLVELCGMAGDAVAEVDGPWECGGRSVGVVGEAGEQAADTADSDADAERNGEEVAGA